MTATNTTTASTTTTDDTPAGFWRDTQGRLVPEAKVKDIDKLRHQVVVDLCRMAREHAWRAAMSAIADSMHTTGTTAYVRFYERTDTQAPWRAIVLDMAGV